MRIVLLQKSPSIFIINLSLFFCLISGFIFISTGNAATCAPDANGNLTVVSGESCTGYQLNNPAASGGVLSNAGAISSSYPVTIQSGTLNNLNNSGSISEGFGLGVYILNGATINTLLNTTGSSIGGGGGAGIVNEGNVGTIINNGRISSALNVGIVNYGTIGILTNNGDGQIYGTVYANGVSNFGVITTLNNLNHGPINLCSQPNYLCPALTYSGQLPTNYNIVLNSAGSYGVLASSLTSYNGPAIGSTQFGISAGSVITKKLYTGVLQNLTTDNIGATRTGNYNGLNYYLALQNGSSTIWDLIFTGGSTADTQSSLYTLSKSLRSSFNYSLMSNNYANMNTYDCNLFDKNNMCISAGGRITTIDNPSSHHSAAVVVLGHKISPHIRIGGFLDQSVNHNMPSGVDMSNKNPMAGAFLVWNHQADGLGLQMKLANAYLDKDVTTSRAVVGTSEAGRGRTDLNTQSYVGELSYAFTYQDSTIVRPYFALRYTRIKQDGYTEDTTASVTSPLTYAKLSDRSTTALMGVKANHALTPKTNLTASLGVEQDLDHQVDKLTATGVADLTSENFNNNIKRTRPVVSAGAYYAVAKNQRLSGEVYYQQLPFQSTGSATAYVNYMIGF
jgi:hypothetical protein